MFAFEWVSNQFLVPQKVHNYWPKYYIRDNSVFNFWIAKIKHDLYCTKNNRHGCMGTYTSLVETPYLSALLNKDRTLTSANVFLL